MENKAKQNQMDPSNLHTENLNNQIQDSIKDEDPKLGHEEHFTIGTMDHAKDTLDSDPKRKKQWDTEGHKNSYERLNAQQEEE